MQSVRQEIQFCTAGDGTRLAYARAGQGPVVVKVANWLSNLEHDWDSPVWRPWLEGWSRFQALYRYDPRGCGLSDRDAHDLSFEKLVSDLERIVDWPSWSSSSYSVCRKAGASRWLMLPGTRSAFGD